MHFTNVAYLPVLVTAHFVFTLSEVQVCWSLLLSFHFVSFNRTQCRVVTGLLTGRNALRSPLHLMGLINIPLCRWCGAEEETSAHVLCELCLHSDMHIWAPFSWTQKTLKA